ncbi:MAG: hypothetical protein J7K22_00755 [Nanoarchaeota archaeon]|nr:hypothetical protein [Nanoarchaeota archaeon]
MEELENQGDELFIIDCAKGIKKVCLIENIEQLETNKIFTMHDFDLAYNLKLMKKIGLIKNVKIFAIPIKISKEEALNQLKKLIKSTLF